MISEDSFAKFKLIAAGNPEVALMVRRLIADTYEEFIEILYEDIDQLILTLQERKQLYFDAQEDAITMPLVDMLVQRGYDASHDTKNGGHVDLFVRGRSPDFLWLGEAKRDNGPAWLSAGMQQLCLRYSDGGKNRSNGGIIVYVQGKKAASILKNWREELEKSTLFEDLKIEDCLRNRGLAFISTHVHDTSGLPYTVRHMAVALYHNPIV